MYSLFSLFVAFCFFMIEAIGAAGQAPVDGWMRVQTDDGEFSIEVPSAHAYFSNKAGFFISELGTSNTFALKNMRMINGFIEDTVVSIECYEASKGALNAIYKEDDRKTPEIESSKIKRSDFSVRQVVQKAEHYYTVRQYFLTKKNIYVLTAASRVGETTASRRFLESVQISVKNPGAVAPNVTKFSSLQMSEPELEMKLNEVYSQPPKQPVGPPLTADNRRQGLIIVHRSRPSYTSSAREKNVIGTVVLRAQFTSSGFIQKIAVLRTLPEGLLRQVLFATIRLKFLPSIEGGTLRSVDKAIEYSFSIY